MKKISDLTKNLFFEKGTERIVNEHQAVMKDFMIFMREDYKDSKRFEYWSGRFARYFKPHKIKYSRIYDAIKICNTKKNPPAYMNWLLRNKKI